ncbi:MAG: hypothetical protein AAFP84_22190, partial [Actinomycetota bacterium]
GVGHRLRLELAAAADATANALTAVAAASTGDQPTIDPDRVRSALSGFQQGTARADQESEQS